MKMNDKDMFAWTYFFERAFDDFVIIARKVFSDVEDISIIEPIRREANECIDEFRASKGKADLLGIKKAFFRLKQLEKRLKKELEDDSHRS